MILPHVIINTHNCNSVGPQTLIAGAEARGRYSHDLSIGWQPCRSYSGVVVLPVDHWWSYSSWQIKVLYRSNSMKVTC